MSFQLRGPLACRWISLWDLLYTSAMVTLRRWKRQKLLHNWSWDFEVANAFSRRHMTRAMSMPGMAKARQLLESIEFDSPLQIGVRLKASDLPGINGNWHVPENAVPDRTMLYLHGGGYAFFVRSHHQMINHIACAARTATFALNYRLTPENPYPAQLDDALAAYQALLTAGHRNGQLVVAGDSAGGHLALSLVNALRDLQLPLPALAVGLCPWTEISAEAPCNNANDRYDWVQSGMTAQFAQWLTAGRVHDPKKISPMAFDASGFPPLYLQAGDREVLHEMIERFAQHVANSGEEVVLDVWSGMTHDFQAYGDLLDESRAALGRIGQAVDHYLGSTRATTLCAATCTVLRSKKKSPRACTRGDKSLENF
jgi:acetyl esterase/lipase